jgi:hypothetical protein
VVLCGAANLSREPLVVGLAPALFEVLARHEAERV